MLLAYGAITPARKQIGVKFEVNKGNIKCTHEKTFETKLFSLLGSFAQLYSLVYNSIAKKCMLHMRVLGG